MSFVGSLLGITGFAIGIPVGVSLGFLVFGHTESTDVKSPVVRPIGDFDKDSLIDILPELPLWIKHPDYERVDWLNDVIRDMWPYLDKAICGMIKSMCEPIFSEYIGTYFIRSIDFERLTFGSLPPIIQGIKVHEMNEDNLVFDLAAKWAGNPNIILVLNVLYLPIKVQLIDMQISASVRVTLKPFVPTFPCFSNIFVSLLDKPDVDFGLKVMGGDLMAIPGLYQFIQNIIKKYVASLYLWPQSLEIPVLDASTGAANKPVGILHVKVVRASDLLKMDLLGSSDPYVKLKLSGGRIIPSKKTSVKPKNLNPEWNEEFKLTVNDHMSQVLELHVFDWEKVGLHDKLGMQVIPLMVLKPNEKKELTIGLVKNLDSNDPRNRKPRGSITVELTFVPFVDDTASLNGPIDLYMRKQTVSKKLRSSFVNRAGLLTVTIISAKSVEGKHHNNPFALVVFKGDKRKTKILKKTRDPSWNEEFQFMLDEAPFEDVIHIEVISKRKHKLGFGSSKEALGHVDINLVDVVYNSRINEKYHLINSRNGMIHVDIKWNAT
ncbi:putative C2 domain, synaptotagmin-like mitochondrial-lipid-binding domain, C2 domain superfamily [Helianthus annuus]|uniref:C2 domain, synaptotagmin-like mitochondrial-lipid-binding domain, C2 domain superfamily n=1 Tax=Helianthus annuus TaxID=4232 RepID=A0A251SQZ1_HELAN|nr:synaptotagmin-3 isoform X2 [Helianthus annuus]KAF5773084.1 putative C2 domain, synaptotagmin-like mitochondrial-lipid-binding domain, C2 domain superfamily [Helianthus annuus]KAJ0480886.1 putative C2 domain, synaptotagmin-like mitochondrial-lipid-binding domain, C2 domain superfamily [Helianthus annuus]KAJ0497444.1 putative C2 domain, synaptotagmin-like mitochondrial-lipid-binding domain, C2 domain superfamily [Helianthus annuus]KAJ0848915.1 putative C2 domain, synaptotagmin-like mitochondri